MCRRIGKNDDGGDDDGGDDDGGDDDGRHCGWRATLAGIHNTKCGISQERHPRRNDNKPEFCQSYPRGIRCGGGAGHEAMKNPMRFEQAVRLLPPGWQTALAAHKAEQVQEGMGGAAVFRLPAPEGDRFLKLASGQAAAALAQEIVRTEWLLRHHLRVPEFLLTAHTENVVAILMTAVAGRHLASGDGDVLGAARAIGRGLARLHAVPVSDCPFDETLEVRMRRAREAVERNLVDASQFDDRNAGASPTEIYERLARTIPGNEELVVVHGDATLSNLLIRLDGELGFIDCGHAGRSDRYMDLAVVEAELRTGFGPDAAQCFKASYGVRAWDEQKAAFFIDLYELF
jgi:aminoglycoside 3'-phosphotransferase II